MLNEHDLAKRMLRKIELRRYTRSQAEQFLEEHGHFLALELLCEALDGAELEVG